MVVPEICGNDAGRFLQQGLNLDSRSGVLGNVIHLSISCFLGADHPALLLGLLLKPI
jgi:hypothetical protein